MTESDDALLTLLLLKVIKATGKQSVFVDFDEVDTSRHLAQYVVSRKHKHGLEIFLDVPEHLFEEPDA